MQTSPHTRTRRQISGDVSQHDPELLNAGSIGRFSRVHSISLYSDLLPDYYTAPPLFSAIYKQWVMAPLPPVYVAMYRAAMGKEAP